MAIFDFLKLKVKERLRNIEKNLGGKSHFNDLIRIQVPKFLFTGFFCYMLWKIQEKIMLSKGVENTHYKAKSLRLEQIEKENQTILEIMEQEKEEDATHQSETAKTQIRQYEQSDTPSQHSYNKLDMNELKIIDEFEDWVHEIRDKQNRFNKKSRD